MIQDKTLVTIADNTGAKIGRIFKVLGSSKNFIAQIGDRVMLSVQKAEPRKTVKKKDVLYAVVVRQKYPYRRKMVPIFDLMKNAVVIIDKVKGEPLAGRVFGPIPREIVERGFQGVASKAPEIV